ncbi:Bor/Iss family lipoprotein [Wenyingzhuangia sp. IMCC45467]
MKKALYTILLGSSLLLTSCYSTIHTFGEGPQTGQEVKGKNKYLFWGLSPLKTTEPQKMANGSDNFEAKTEFTIVDQFLSIITLGIYGQSTTTVSK